MSGPQLLVQGFISQHFTKYTTGEGHLAYTLTGIAATFAKGTGSNWVHLHASLDIPIPDLPAGKALRLFFFAPFVTLNSIANDQAAINAGWAVDDFGIGAPAEPKRTLQVNTTLAVRDVDGFIFRIGYQVHLIGALVDQPHP
jgi:hypothetical protein